MVELVDDDYIEVVGLHGLKLGAVKALDRREDVLEAGRSAPSDPEFTEGGVAEGVLESAETLLQDLFTVGNEEQSVPAKVASKAGIVDGRHHRLARTHGSHEQIALPP